MTKKEINEAQRQLKTVGRYITRCLMDDAGRRVINTDGDGVSCPFGCPHIFYSLLQVSEFVAQKRLDNEIAKSDF